MMMMMMMMMMTMAVMKYMSRSSTSRSTVVTNTQSPENCMQSLNVLLPHSAILHATASTR
eukprot:10829557-Heterocapsa_arctica.AAC.1